MNSKRRQKIATVWVIVLAVMMAIALIMIYMHTVENPIISRQPTQTELISTLGIILVIVGIVLYDVFIKNKRKTSKGVRRGWSPQEKEKIRMKQSGMCNRCGNPPPRWEYHHKDGNRSNNSLRNCEGLCPNCHSVETYE